MANSKFLKGREHILNANVNWPLDTIRAVLVDMDDYTLDINLDEYLSAIPTAARVATTDLTGKTVTGGYADADDGLWTAVSGDQCEAVVVYKWTGSAGSSPLIAFIDDAANLPVIPGGGNIEVQWSSEGGIFRI